MFRRVSLVLLTLVAALALFVTPAAAARPFPQTNFSVTNDKFLDYFDHRGGARVLGYPISREFDFMGSRVQFFQRAVLQLTPDGGVALLNILDQGLLPYTHINGSTFPAPDPSVIQAAPSPNDPDYAAKAIAFVRDYAPNGWQGMNTNFFNTFTGTVTAQDAFPNGGNTDLLPLINLEIWGLPTSRPTPDPNNGNFVYLRFQRGIMHFDKTSGLTQGILIGDYLKGLITGQNLPGDLAQEAQGSKLYLQYNNGVANGLNRPADLPATNMFAAFEQDGVNVAAPAPAPTATPVPPTATPAAPAAVTPPAAIAVTGSSWFVEQTNAALTLLSNKASSQYSLVRQYVYRIDEAASPSYDVANRALKIDEATAFPSNWRSNQDAQREWLAGLIVHNATHIQQGVNGQPTTGLDAEVQPRLNQRDVLQKIDTTTNGDLFHYLDDVVNGREGSFTDWNLPRDPTTANQQ